MSESQSRSEAAPRGRHGATRERLMDVLTAFHDDHGRMPTWKELLPLMGMRSRGSLNRHIDCLCREGWLTVHPRGSLPISLNCVEAP